MARPPIDTDLHTPTPTLRSVLNGLRDNKANADCSKYSLEQSVLLPTAILACIYDRYSRDAYAPGGNNIDKLQSRHVDKLALSGEPFLGALEQVFERLSIWDGFLEARVESTELWKANAAPRDKSSGDYNVYNIRDPHVENARASRPVGEDGALGREDSHGA